MYKRLKVCSHSLLISFFLFVASFPIWRKWFCQTHYLVHHHILKKIFTTFFFGMIRIINFFRRLYFFSSSINMLLTLTHHSHDITHGIQERWGTIWGEEDLPCISLSSLGASVMHKLRYNPLASNCIVFVWQSKKTIF